MCTKDEVCKAASSIEHALLGHSAGEAWLLAVHGVVALGRQRREDQELGYPWLLGKYKASLVPRDSVSNTRQHPRRTGVGLTAGLLHLPFHF